jgi:hypothetical protein
LNPRTHTLPIRTPEGIVFSQVLASPVTRCLAWSLDLVPMAAGGSTEFIAGGTGIEPLDAAGALRCRSREHGRRLGRTRPDYSRRRVAHDRHGAPRTI